MYSMTIGPLNLSDLFFNYDHTHMDAYWKGLTPKEAITVAFLHIKEDQTEEFEAALAKDVENFCMSLPTEYIDAEFKEWLKRDYLKRL